VTQGAPDALTKAFIEWVLTDGQAFVDETGYIQLSQAQLQEAMEKLKADGE
jgi:phosphate transport system substrate-binding protein